MNVKDKLELFKDLCARLPYDVVVHTDCGDVKLDRNHRDIGILYYEHYNDEAKKACNYDTTDFKIIISGCYYGENLKPYLRPMSSITKKEEEEFNNLPTYLKVDFYNSHHLDYRDLISMGLALEALEGMYDN